jgi:hypothetical protein
VSNIDYRSHSCAPECAEHPFSSGYDWSAGIRAVASPSGHDREGLLWQDRKLLEILARERAERTLRRRAAEAEDRRDWVEGIRRRLGLVSEVHKYRVWSIADDWWAWACERPGCRDTDWQYPDHSASSKGRVVAKASAHRRRFMPAAPESEPGAGLDLTGCQLTAEYGTRLGSGGYQTWDTSPRLEEIYPVAKRIEAARRDHGGAYRRRIIVVQDWTEVDAP